MKQYFLVILAALAAASPGLSQGEDPLILAAHFEDIPTSNASVLQCYVFQTTPGVRYQVEVSSDLVSWTDQDEVYGLGHEYVVTMRESIPAPPEESGSPPPAPSTTPTKSASLRMQPATGSAGGTVIAWPSLDHGGPMIVRIAGALDAAWSTVPLYVSGFGDYQFLVWHPTEAIEPPAANPQLGPEDTAMLAALEQNLPAMNTEVATSAARSRNAPPPAPGDPEALRFWRIKVDARIDTDSDGTPDWAEFHMAAHGIGGMAAGVVGDAFNADTNNDGIPDGLQIDSDQDGTPDANDPAVSDNTASFPIGPVPRYAVFPITNAQPSDYTNARQISDKGTVLYENGTWTGGVWTPLETPGDGQAVYARGINDQNQIIGRSGRTVGNPAAILETICFWSSPDASLSWATIGAGASEKFAGVPSEEFRWAYLTPGPVLSNDGHFSAFTWSKTENGGYDLTHPGYWQLPSGGQALTEVAGDHRLDYNQTPNLRWGAGYPLHSPDQGTTENEEDTSQPIERLMFAPGALPSLPFTPTNLLAYTGSPIIALPSIYENHQGMAYINGAWKASETYANAIDMAADGTAIARRFDSNAAAIILNGKPTEINRAAPGVSNSWKDITVSFLDTTPGGWILALRGVYPLIGVSDAEYSVMLPLRVDGVDPSLSIPPLTPPLNPPEYLNGGVDHASTTAFGGIGRANEIWIMAPNGGASNTVRFQSPLNSTSKLTLVSDADVGFAPEVLDQKDMEITITGKRADTADISPALMLGGAVEAVSAPIKIKTMKRRTVKVAVHKVFGIDGSGNQTSPANFPTKAALDDYLNEVYGRQTNTFFDCNCTHEEKGPLGTGIPFDSTPNVSPFVPDLKLVANITDPELQDAIPNQKSDGNNPTANIDVWIIGGGVRLIIDGNFAYGAHLGAQGEGKVIINGDLTYYPASPPLVSAQKLLLHVIAHEIGHVMAGSGHPDLGQGNAPLLWRFYDKYWPTDRRDNSRLMCSGDHTEFKRPGRQLIKKEWDLIDAWLKKNKIGEDLTPP